MPRKRFSVEQIINYLREADVRLARGETAGDCPASVLPGQVAFEIAKLLGVTDPMKVYRLRIVLGRMPSQVRFYETQNLLTRPAKVRDELRRIERLCATPSGEDGSHGSRLTRILENLQDVTLSRLIWEVAWELSPEHPSWAIRDGKAEARLRECFSDKARLQELARKARVRMERHIVPKRGGRRKRPDLVIREVILDLGHFYYEITGRSPGHCQINLSWH